MNIIRRGVSTRDAGHGRCRDPNCVCRRGTRDAETVRTQVARYPGARFTAEREGEDLVVYVTQEATDTGTTYDRRVRDSGAFLQNLNEKNRAFWARQNGGGR
jgi:hypothetical protein